MSARCEKHNHGPSMHPCPKCPPLTAGNEIRALADASQKQHRWTSVQDETYCADCKVTRYTGKDPGPCLADASKEGG